MEQRESTRPGFGPTVAIVGAGIAGLCMGVRLARAGIRSFTLFEREGRLGGTWRDNAYPGSGCDVPSHLYCFSFFPNPDFSRKYSGQAEIEDYLERCADAYDLRRHIRFGTEIASARFDERTCRWTLRTTAGEELEADVLVSGTGQLNRPVVPQLPGRERFAGRSFHSTGFPRDADFAGRRVALVGSGASAIQIVPRVAERAAHLTVFQRTPSYVVPRGDRAYGPLARALFRHVPLALRLHRALLYLQHEVRFFALLRDSRVGRVLRELALAHLEAHVPEGVLREALRPDYPVGCKRVLISDDYYPALRQPNVSLVTEGIDRFVEGGLVTADGASHLADDVVFATGFDSTSFLAPMEIEGRRRQRLSEAWREGAEAYLGLAVSGFPNLFLLYGPGTNLGHNSIIFMIECQVAYVMRCLERLKRGRAALDVRPEEMAGYNKDLQARLAKTAWSADCTSWYKTASGKITNNWPRPALEYWWRTRRPDFRAFESIVPSE